MTSVGARLRVSLAFRLVMLYSLGSAAIMAGLGYTLYHALRLQLEVRDRAEIAGKAEVVEYLLREVGSPTQLEQHLQRFREIPVGHPHLSIGVKRGGAWLVRPREDVVAVAGRVDALLDDPASGITVAPTGDGLWWLRQVRHRWPEASSRDAPVDVLIAVDVSESRRLLDGHAVAAALVAVVGTLLSGLLAFFVARRGLAPIAEVAARAEHITAHHLNTALSTEDAPTEIRGLALSINRMLERLNDSFSALEQFSADIAHELRTPLNNLLLQTQIVLNRPREAGDYREALLSNLDELQRLHRMVSDMLFLARADYGMLGMAVVFVDLAQEAVDVAEYFEAAASARLQLIEIDGQSVVSGDRLMIRRAITNLLSNAVRYAPCKTSIRIHIETVSDAALVEVTNEYSVIPAEELSRLFNRFSRRIDQPQDGGEGAGLGLAIVRSIMRMHGGVAFAESGECGVRFTLRFPIIGNRIVQRGGTSDAASGGADR